MGKRKKTKRTGLEPNVVKVDNRALKPNEVKAGSRPRGGYEPVAVRPDDIARQARKTS